MRVSVIIVNWNGLEKLKPCLKALQEQTKKPAQIIVVDNGSNDGSVAWLQAQETCGLKVVPLSENRGFSGGNNAAWSHVDGDIVALLNNDTVVQPTWVEAALKAFEKPGTDMVACKIVRLQDPATMDKAGHLMYRDGLNRGRGTGHPASAFEAPGEALWPDGCAAFYRKALLEEIGFFDDDFYLYGEDADLGFRARWAGAKCWYAPQSLVYHHHSASLGKFSPTKAYYIERNRLWVLVKNFPMTWLLLAPFYTVARYAMNVVSMLQGRGSAAGFQAEHGKTALAKALIRATWDGAWGLPRMWRKRRSMVRRMSSKEMKRLLNDHAISLKEITLTD